MAGRYGITSDKRAKLFGRLRDLWKDTKSCLALPTYGYGLKSVANCFGFSWRDETSSAMDSAALYLQYVQNPEDNDSKLETIKRYNEDDCQATKVVKDWLSSH
jgi:uncharacterized protein